MTTRRRHARHARPGRCLLAVVLATAYLAGAVGFPMPIRSASSAARTRACGCDAADQCCGRCCCCQPAAAAAEPEVEDCPACRASAIRWVVGVQEQQCRGLTTLWLSCGVCLPPLPPVVVAADATPAGSTVPAQPAPIKIAKLPDIPPPRADRTLPARLPCFVPASVPTGGMSAS